MENRSEGSLVTLQTILTITTGHDAKKRVIYCEICRSIYGTTGASAGAWAKGKARDPGWRIEKADKHLTSKKHENAVKSASKQSIKKETILSSLQKQDTQARKEREKNSLGCEFAVSLMKFVGDLKEPIKRFGELVDLVNGFFEV